jgi:hypothetical protein
MPYTDLLSCNNYSNPGLKKLWILTHQTNGNVIQFPLNITLTSDTDYIVEFSADTINQVVNIGGQLMNYVIVDSYENSTYVDERIEARQGVYYQKTLSIDIPRMSNYTSNQIMDFLFNVTGAVAIANVCVIFEDSNNELWICGWDSPAIMQGGNLQTDLYDTTENKYTYTFISKSVNRTYQCIRTN